MYTQYTCGKCGGSISKTTHICPHCRANLSGIRCKNCGFVGSELSFIGDRCPKCYTYRHPTPTTSNPTTEACPKCHRSLGDVENPLCENCGWIYWEPIIIFLSGLSLILLIVFFFGDIVILFNSSSPYHGPLIVTVLLLLPFSFIAFYIFLSSFYSVILLTIGLFTMYLKRVKAHL